MGDFFDRLSMEQITSNLVSWSRGVMNTVMNYSVGRIVYSIYEAVATEIERLYDKAWRAIRQANETNIYSITGFAKLPAVYATGTVTFSRDASNPADQDYVIPAGTLVQVPASGSNPPVQFATTSEVTLTQGSTSVNATVICTQAGTTGNALSGTITQLVTAPLGITYVTNSLAFTNGAEEETPSAQRARFVQYNESLMRGTLIACQNGALTARLVDANGNATEYVTQSIAFEDLTNKLGQVDVYTWGSLGTPSTNLINQTVTVLKGGYTLPDGTVAYGYKPAGIIPNVYAGTQKSVYLQLTVTPESWTTLSNLEPTINTAIGNYFAGLKMGQTAVRSAIEALVKDIDGVFDVSLEMSTDNATWSYNNITSSATDTSVQMLVPVTPFSYIQGTSS